MKVKKKHLTGKIADFPLHVVQAMVDEQQRQGNKADPSVFARLEDADQKRGGFDWAESRDCFAFWSRVIGGKQFNLIPKPTKPNGHPHAKLMKQYAKDAETSETPWELWELQIDSGDKWRALSIHPSWCGTSRYRRKSDNQAEPAADSNAQPKPNEIIRAMLAKGMEVWASVSDESYDKARNNIGHCICQIVGYDETDEYPMQTRSLGWKFAVPVDRQIMTEITEIP